MKKNKNEMRITAKNPNNFVDEIENSSVKLMIKILK